MSEGMKFRVNSPEQSRMVQERLFKMGYYWASNGNCAAYLDRPYLFADGSDMTLTYADYSGNYFLNHKYPEYDFVYGVTEFTLKKSPEETVETVETVELNGKMYLKENLEAALAKLTPIE
jgi:hypothetical protein